LSHTRVHENLYCKLLIMI